MLSCILIYKIYSHLLYLRLMLKVSLRDIYLKYIPYAICTFSISPKVGLCRAEAPPNWESFWLGDRVKYIGLQIFRESGPDISIKQRCAEDLYLCACLHRATSFSNLYLCIRENSQLGGASALHSELYSVWITIATDMGQGTICALPHEEMRGLCFNCSVHNHKKVPNLFDKLCVPVKWQLWYPNCP